MPKTAQTPAAVLQSLINEYQINPFSLSKGTHIDYQTIRKILSGEGKISVPTALKLGKYFGQSPSYFMNVQFAADINELSENKTYIKQLKNIQKAQKPTGKTVKNPEKTKSKTKTLAEKRKTAAKVPGARAAKRKRSK